MHYRLLHILFFFSGFPALFYQIVWQRSLFVLYGVNIESVTLVVTAFMLGLGLGSLFGGWLSRVAQRFALPIFGGIELVIGLFGFFSLAIFQWIGDATIQVSYIQMLGVSFVLTCLPTFLMGMTLPLFVGYLVNRDPNVGGNVGSLYCVNTLGAGVACFLLAFFVMRMFGQQLTVAIAAAMNICIGIVAIGVGWVERFLRNPTFYGIVGFHEKQKRSTQPTSAVISMPFAIILSALSGYLALSYEILWIRFYSVVSGGLAPVFALILGYYLIGLAIGAWVSRSFNSIRTLGMTTLSVSLLSFLLFPFVAWLAQYRDYSVTLSYVGILSILLGFNLPLLSQSAVRADSRAGSGVSYLYFANIIGSVAGSLITGFILLDYYSLQQISVFLACAGFILAMLFSWRLSWISMILALACWASAPILFQNIYEKIIYKTPDAEKFAQIIENKHGVITVSQDGVVYGGGVYDGQLRVDLGDDRNGMIRAFVIGTLHPEPKEVLMIGLSSGSWAKVLAEHPQIEKLTIVEINPGYLKLSQPHPKVEIIIDDGRRWLRRHPERKFDLIVMNTSFHFRAHTSNLLSKEFLEMVRPALNPGGIFYYNTTSSKEALRTAITTYPYALRVMNFIAVSDSPLHLDEHRWRMLLTHVKEAPELELRDSLLHSTEGARVITDDNMGTEWGE